MPSRTCELSSANSSIIYLFIDSQIHTARHQVAQPVLNSVSITRKFSFHLSEVTGKLIACAVHFWIALVTL